MPLVQGDPRQTRSFETAQGFTEEQAQREASRCLRCDLAYCCPTINMTTGDAVEPVESLRTRL
jgi:hypothetical protein